MDWTIYVAIVAVVAVAVFVHSLVSELVKQRGYKTEAWRQLSDVIGAITIRRIMNIVPNGSADRIDYRGIPFLGTFELTNRVLKFYRLKIKNGSIIEFPIDHVRESIAIDDERDPSVTLKIEAPNGKRFSIDARMPKSSCERLMRLGNNSDFGQS